MAAQASSEKPKLKVLVVADATSPELKVLDSASQYMDIVGVGQTASDFASLTDDEFASVNVLLNCGVLHTHSALRMHRTAASGFMYRSSVNACRCW